MKQILIMVVLLGLMFGMVYPLPPEGSITGVVVDSRRDEDQQQALLVEVQGDKTAYADKIRLKIPAKTAGAAKGDSLPEGWALTFNKGYLELSGSKMKLPIFLKVDLGKASPPGKTTVEVYDGDKRKYKKKGVLIKRLPPVKVSSDFTRVIKFPPVISPGDRLMLKPFDYNLTPYTGTWSVGEVEAEYEEEFQYYSLELPKTLKLGASLSLSYTDPYGYNLYYTDKLKDLVILEYPEGKHPSISGVSPMVFVGDLICICGYFPDQRSRDSLLLDGKPMGTPLSASSHVVVHRLPGDITPGTHRISGPESAGYPAGSVYEFEAIRVGGSIDRNKLMRGDSTPLRLRIEGTEKILTVKLTNNSPEIIRLDGGNEQDITTSGGTNNSLEKMVHGISPGNFRLNYKLDLSFCPCSESDQQEDEGEELTFENLFDETFHEFREARDLANEAANNRHDNLELAKLRAQEALARFTRTREKLKEGEANGEIGPTTAQSFRRFISEYETQARNVLEIKQEEELPVTHVPEPVSSRPEEQPHAVVTDGWLAPSQAVWQDDDTFRDFTGKQLTKTGPGQWQAELKMVVNKNTLVFGTREDGRNRIKIMGTTNGSRLVKVKFRFKLIQGSTEKIVYTEPKAQNHVALDGPAGVERPFAASIMAPRGLPTYRSFTIDSAGAYRIEAELLRENGSETGLKISVSGEAVQTYGPAVRIVPVVLSSDNRAAWGGALTHIAQTLAGQCQEGIPRFYPLAPNGMTVTAEPLQNLRNLEPGTLTKLKGLLPFTDTTEEVRADSLSAAMAQRFGTGAAMNGGPKVVVLLSDNDFDLTRRGGTAQAYCGSQKFIVARHNTNFESIAHELVHSMPYLWTRGQMVQNFNINYHNSADNKYGDGVDVRSYGGVMKKREHAIMGSAYIGKWITQGTYWHLLNQFLQRPDPELLLVRGYIARESGKNAGYFLPSYQVMGIADLQAADATKMPKWSVVLKDGSGKEIARYPVHAQWMVPDLEVERKILSFTYRLPWNKSIHNMTLVAPAGIVDSKVISASAPVVKITSPSDGSRVSGKTIPIRWQGNDPDNDPLYYSLFYSPDNGRKWRIVLMDSQDQSFQLPISGNPSKLRIKLTVTDGMRSSSHEIKLNR